LRRALNFNGDSQEREWVTVSPTKKGSFCNGKTAIGKFFTMLENLKKFKKNLDIHYRNIYICAKFKQGEYIGLHTLRRKARENGEPHNF
jgi:hypothetical protein